MRASTRQFEGYGSWITMPPSCPPEEEKEAFERSESPGRMPELGASCYSRAWRDEGRWSPRRNAPCRQSHSTPFAWNARMVLFTAQPLGCQQALVYRRRRIPLPVGQVEKGEPRRVRTPLFGLDVWAVIGLITVAGRLRGRHAGCGAVGIWICEDMTAIIVTLQGETLNKYVPLALVHITAVNSDQHRDFFPIRFLINYTHFTSLDKSYFN